ncbi:rhomboid family intramembrane serine protease [Aureivirga sp. CE67]|uniref:rhomboid family intramembrane serine protease n=1 Tax=Aureivirga sp. CE67 TaxID=1788983 RepID=UPI0018CB658B|nr:rhomboid family intramembrane serine protease [Aureivirga sp. CE67]
MSLIKEFKEQASTSFKVVAVLWIIFILDILFSNLFNFHFSRFGIIPRKISSLGGIFSAPFLHGSLYHIISNTVPLFILLSVFLTFYKKNAAKILLIAITLVGLLTWVIGRNASHIGASGVIYFLASFLFFSGLFQKKAISIIISILVFLFYGSMFWGIFPSLPYISWEGHLSGFLVGLFLAFMYKKQLAENNEEQYI